MTSSPVFAGHLVLALSVVDEFFKVCGIDSTLVANTLHPRVFLSVKLLDVASALAGELELLPAGEAGEACFHVSHHNVHS